MSTSRKPSQRALRSSTSTYDKGKPLPTHRVNLATMTDILRDRVDVVTTAHALRRLPVSKQVVDRVLWLDPREVLDHYKAKFADAPIIATGIPISPPPHPIPASRPRKGPWSNVRPLPRSSRASSPARSQGFAEKAGVLVGREPLFIRQQI